MKASVKSRSGQRSIVTVIKEDHIPLKKEIRILKSESATETQKKKSLARFIKALKLHSKSEELSLYRPVIDDDVVRDAVLEGFEEHALADLLVAQLEVAGFEQHWVDEVAAKAKVLAELVEHHVNEEEQELLPKLQAAYDIVSLREFGRVYEETYAVLKREITSQAHALEFFENHPDFRRAPVAADEVEHESSILLGGSRI